MLQVYNTLARSKQKFLPISGRKVSMFVCGQTPYDDAHLGHAKAYINFDVVARWLRHLGYKVRYVQNITDIEDKIINRARERGEDPFKLARHYEARLLEDLQAIGVKDSIDMFPRSHDYIDAIREQMQMLADRGYAYPLDGDVYYDVAKFKGYTKLSGMSLDALSMHRIEPRAGKRHEYDFALWKAAKPGEPSWDISIRFKDCVRKLPGRPAWHIEDTAMTYKIFGPQYDIHGGASELIFPHHTNEIAQAEAASGKRPFVKYWLHAGVLNIRGEKMSKSLKNFITIRELLQSYSAEELRYMMCSSHYRKELDYDAPLMESARRSLRYIYSALSMFYNMGEEKGAKESRSALKVARTLERGFTAAMNDDFNTSLALSRLAVAVGELRSFAESHERIDAHAKQEALGMAIGLPQAIGLITHDTYKKGIPAKAYELVKAREALRSRKEFAKADEIRARLKGEYGIMLEDTEHGTVWYSAEG